MDHKMETVGSGDNCGAGDGWWWCSWGDSGGLGGGRSHTGRQRTVGRNDTGTKGRNLLEFSGGSGRHRLIPGQETVLLENLLVLGVDQLGDGRLEHGGRDAVDVLLGGGGGIVLDEAAREGHVLEGAGGGGRAEKRGVRPAQREGRENEFGGKNSKREKQCAPNLSSRPGTGCDLPGLLLFRGGLGRGAAVQNYILWLYSSSGPGERAVNFGLNYSSWGNKGYHNGTWN